MAEVERFLQSVITTPEGWLCLLVGPPFHEEWYRWPQDMSKVAARAAEASQSSNVYFAPHLFSKQDAHKEYVLPTRTIVADLDYASVPDLVLAPSVLVETSPGRHQAYWVLRENVSPEDLEVLSRGMTYSIPDCDHSGWPLGHRFRLPTTLNYKYHQPAPINVVAASGRTYMPEQVRDYLARYAGTGATQTARDLDLEWEPRPMDVGVEELFERVRRAMGGKAASYFKNPAKDRSEALWAFMNGLFRAGLDRDEVYALAQASVNNKFADSKYHGNEDLKKDVLRAERAYSRAVRSVKDLIREVLLAPGSNAQKRMMISDVVLKDMEREGEFVVTSSERAWYLRRETGRPVLLSRNSDFFESLMETRYGLNKADGSYDYVFNHLKAFTLDRGRPAKEASLSSYDGHTLLIHGGRQTVWHVTESGLTTAPDGQYGVLFPWISGEDTLTIDSPLPVEDWADWMTEGFFDNLVELTRDEAVALVRVWVLFILFRDDAVARPILALFGQQGSGKSTLYRLLYAVLYGGSRSINSITTPDHFDQVVSEMPFVAFDNVDTWERWLPDRLALSAAKSDVVKRRLYTDTDTVTQQRNALIGLSAHSPQFGREDVVDRLLIVNFQRLQHFKSEQPLVSRVLKNRNRLWGSIVQDAQAVLRTPVPREEDLPQIRVLDFSRVGLRIARAVHREDLFLSAIHKLRTSQTRFVLSEADELVEVIRRWHDTTGRKEDEWLTAGRLWEVFKVLDDNFARTYRSPSVFARKLWTMSETLRTVFRIEHRIDTARNVRMWRIEPHNAA